jgi:nicotinamidase-related amidase
MRRTGVDHLFHIGTLEHEIIEELKPEPGELIIYKNSIGAFNSTAIDQILRNLGVETLVITGGATNGCVETTARDAADRGYNCFLVDDGCVTKNQELHDGTMRNFELLFGKVSTTQEVIDELSRLLQEKKGYKAAV